MTMKSSKNLLICFLDFFFPKPFNISHISHHGNTTGKDKYHDTVPKHYAYISSPSLYFNPKDRDNNSDISTFSRATPKQSLQFVNHSTPSPKSFKPLVHSPVKQPSSSRHSKPVRIPDRVSCIIWWFFFLGGGVD